MGVRGFGALGVALLVSGCASDPAARMETSSAAQVQEDGQAPGGAGGDAFAVKRYVDRDLGFEIERPEGEEWAFAAGHEAPEGILIPVVVLHAGTGAQVVVQIAPEVAPPMTFAERLAVGLRSKPGFTTSVPEATRRGSAFRFAMGDAILGTVDITSNSGRLYVLLGTWPSDAPESVARDVRSIVDSLRTVVFHEAELR